MPVEEKHRVYTRRVNSNGEDVYPTVCATIYKFPQKQADDGGGYIIDYFKLKTSHFFRKDSTPLTTTM